MYEKRTPARWPPLSWMQRGDGHPRYRQRRIHVLLRREGWKVNKKRVGKLWRLEGLQVPVRKRKRRRMGHSANSCQRRPATAKNEVWCYDFKRRIPNMYGA